MSWKMFGQIVLLIIIAVVIMAAAKAAKYRMCSMSSAKRMSMMSKCSQNFGPNASVQKQKKRTAPIF